MSEKSNADQNKEDKAMTQENKSSADENPKQHASTATDVETQAKVSKASNKASQRSASDVTTKSRENTNINKGKAAKTGALWFFTLLNFLFLIGLIAAAYWAWMQWQNTQGQNEQTKQLIDQQVASLKSEVSNTLNDTRSSNQTLQGSVNNLVDEVLNLKQENQELQSKLSEISGRRPSDWLLAEADYLVRMAGRKLWLENDVKTAMMMLSSADTRLADLGDPSLFPVRKLIAQDIQTLHGINPVSLSSIALALSALVPQVDQLPIASVKIPEAEEIQAEQALSENISDWRSNIAKTWRAIVDDFISVSRTEQAVQPFLAQKQQWLVKEQVKFALTQAQNAVMQENQTLFKASLQQATAGIVEYFELSSPQVDQFIAAIQQLQSSNIEKQYPNKLASQAALSDLLDGRSNNKAKDTEEEAL